MHSKTAKRLQNSHSAISVLNL